jgi:hypothetical protein
MLTIGLIVPTFTLSIGVPGRSEESVLQLSRSASSSRGRRPTTGRR